MSNYLTTVGPEPVGSNGDKSLRKVNIEALLLMAKYNDNFQKKLIEDRKQALIDSGIEFSKGEKTLLKNIEIKKLKEYIKSFEIKGITKKSLKSWASAASIIMLLSSLLIKCGYNTTDSDIDTTSWDGSIPDHSYIEYLNLPNDKDIEDIFPTSNSSEKSKE